MYGIGRSSAFDKMLIGKIYAMSTKINSFLEMTLLFYLKYKYSKVTFMRE